MEVVYGRGKHGGAGVSVLSLFLPEYALDWVDGGKVDDYGLMLMLYAR